MPRTWARVSGCSATNVTAQWAPACDCRAPADGHGTPQIGRRGGADAPDSTGHNLVLRRPLRFRLPERNWAVFCRRRLRPDDACSGRAFRHALCGQHPQPSGSGRGNPGCEAQRAQSVRLQRHGGDHRVRSLGHAGAGGGAVPLQWGDLAAASGEKAREEARAGRDLRAPRPRLVRPEASQPGLQVQGGAATPTRYAACSRTSATPGSRSGSRDTSSGIGISPPWKETPSPKASRPVPLGSRSGTKTSSRTDLSTSPRSTNRGSGATGR